MPAHVLYQYAYMRCVGMQVILGDAFFGSDRALADNNATLAFVEVRQGTSRTACLQDIGTVDCADDHYVVCMIDLCIHVSYHGLPLHACDLCA